MINSTTLITKYRPINFEEVLGNVELITALAKAVRSKNCPHGYLFTGSAGIGKTTLARIIAREVNASINEIDAATHSGVDDTRLIVETSGFTSIMLQQNKMYIIDECHNLSPKAWQPLLKLIEEPPPSIFIALCTTDPKNIPETVKSRCFAVPLRPLKSNDVQDLIMAVADLEGWPLNNDCFMPMVMAAEGSARKALSILQAGHDAQSLDELSKIVLKVEAENDPVIQLCQYLMSGRRDWRPVQGYLARIEDYEEALQSMTRYLTAAMTRSEDLQAHDIWMLLQKLMRDVSWDKKVQLYSGVGSMMWGQLPF